MRYPNSLNSLLAKDDARSKGVDAQQQCTTSPHPDLAFWAALSAATRYTRHTNTSHTILAAKLFFPAIPISQRPAMWCVPWSGARGQSHGSPQPPSHTCTQFGREFLCHLDFTARVFQSMLTPFIGTCRKIYTSRAEKLPPEPVCERTLPRHCWKSTKLSWKSTERHNHCLSLNCVTISKHSAIGFCQHSRNIFSIL